MIDPSLLEILRCPETHQALSIAAPELVARINESISTGRLRNNAGEAVNKPIEGGLIREDRRLMYPVIDGIPVMLIDEAIPLDQPESGSRQHA
jgi:uncharacterized protein YbaR (Trm112 family)